MALLEIHGLSKAFGGVQALNQVDFYIEGGEIVSVIGPNGAGKTSFFNVISGLFPPDEGSIVFEGDDITHHAPNEVTRRGIARTFQNVRLFPNMTVLENVMVGQHCRTRAGVLSAVFNTPSQRAEEKMIKEKAASTLEFFGTRLAGYRHDQPAFALSYANRRRLEIARALATEPRLLLLDEPTAGMNPRETIELTDLIGRIPAEKGVTVVVISHEMKVVEDVSDRVVVLDHGEKIAEGSYDAVAHNPDVIEAYLGRPAGEDDD